VVYNATAYRLLGPSTLDKARLTKLGMASSSLGGATVQAREVLGSAATPVIYVESDQKELLEFQPLERTFEGRTYRLRSAALTAFGVWPMLPSDIAQPTSADGSPTFSAVSTDSAGVAIYRRTSLTTAQGIGVAPGAPASDPAGGNPNWTWWTPAP
jgi:hypothetical protein